MTGDTSKPGASRRRALLRVEDTHDLRAAVSPPRDALDITSPLTQRVRDPVPGTRIAGSLWEGERFIVRVPRAWNGRLVVAGTPGQRTEVACDVLFSDPLVASGYAYACGNKGNGDGVAVLTGDERLVVDRVALPRFPVGGAQSIAFWQHAPGKRIEAWLDETIALTQLAKDILTERCGRGPDVTYAVGLSNGGYQVRRAVEESDLFDGALVWNAVLWSREHNVLNSLADAVAAFANGTPERIPGCGFPPDIASRSGSGSLYAKNAAVYWFVTLWLHAMHLDPQTSIAYGDVGDAAPAESWCTRIAQWRPERSVEIARRIDGFANTGRIRCKTIDLCSEYDHLVPPAVHFAPYARLVEAAGRSHRYRARTIAGAPHVDAWAPDPEYPSLRPGHASVLEAWDELVAWVEGDPVNSR